MYLIKTLTSNGSPHDLFLEYNLGTHRSKYRKVE